MSNLPQLLYSGAPYEGSPYIIELYDNASMHIIHKDGQEKTIIVTPEELICIFISGLSSIEDIFEQLSESNKDQINYFTECLHRHLPSMLPPAPDRGSLIDKEPIKKQLTNTYKKLRDSIEVSYKKAVEQNKKLLIACGEYHNTFHSFIIELMISQICQDLGIKNLMIESQTFSPLEQNYEEDVAFFTKDNPEFAIITQGIEFVLYNTNLWQIFPIDPLDNKFEGNDTLSWKTFSKQEACGLKTRAIAMNESIAKINQSAFSITGASHVFDMCVPERTGAQDLRSQYVILPINTAPIISQDKIKNIEFVENLCKDSLRKKLAVEFGDLSNNESVDSNKFSKYEEEKLSNSIIAERVNYMQSPEVVQTPDVFLGQPITVREAVTITLSVMQDCNKERNASNSNYLQPLATTLENTFELINELALNMSSNSLININDELIGNNPLAESEH